MKTILIRAAVVLVILYVVAVGTLAAVMRRPPEKFGAFMKHVPLPVMMVLPFETLWMRARAGHLQVGDRAPDFELPTADKQARVRLSSFQGKQPVVLIFGSYT